MLWMLVACFEVERHEDLIVERTQEMVDHESDAMALVSSLQAKDLAAARKSAKALAREDKVDLLAPQQLMLDQMRKGARAVASADDIQAAGQAATLLTAHCASCHTALEVPTVTPTEGAPLKQAWMALAWEDERLWSNALTAAPELGMASSWPERRQALAAHLVQ